jgi:hypothetical protein
MYMAKRTNSSGSGSSALGGAVAGGALGGMVGGAGGTTITMCTAEDQSFYCKFVRGFNIFKMILYVIMIFVLIWIVWKAFGPKK